MAVKKTNSLVSLLGDWARQAIQVFLFAQRPPFSPPGTWFMRIGAVGALVLFFAVLSGWISIESLQTDQGALYVEAGNLREKADALFQDKRYAQAVDAYETAARAWWRAAEHNRDNSLADGQSDYQFCMKIARQMTCMQNFAEARILEKKAWDLSSRKRYWEAENAYIQAQRAWLAAARGCDDTLARQAEQSAERMADYAQKANEYLSAQTSSIR